MSTGNLLFKQSSQGLRLTVVFCAFDPGSRVAHLARARARLCYSSRCCPAWFPCAPLTRLAAVLFDVCWSREAKGAKPTSDALQYARTRGHKDIEKILIDAGAKE